MSFWKNTDSSTEKIFSKLISKFFPHLRKCNILITHRDKEKKDSEGGVVIAEARKCSNKEFDLWEYHFEICLDTELWAKSNKVDKYRVAFHELLHCGVVMEEGTTLPKYDDNNRLKTYLIPHDIKIMSFQKEIEIFGFDGSDKPVADFFADMLDNPDRLKKAKKAFLAALEIEIYKDLDVKKKKKKRTEEDEDAEPIKKKKKKSSQISMGTLKKKRVVEDDDEDI